jgi:hypothetical protein
MTNIIYRYKSTNITEACKVLSEGYNGVAFINAGDKIAYLNGAPISPAKGVSFMTENLLAKDCSEFEVSFEAGATTQNLIMFYRECKLC